MNFKIQHEMKGRIRVHLMQNIMTFQQADLLQYYLRSFHNIKETKIYVRTCGIVISYNGNRKSVLDALKQFQYSKFQSPSTAIEDSGRKLTVKYQERLVQKTIIHFGAKIFLPYQLRALWISLRAARFIYKGLCSIAKTIRR